MVFTKSDIIGILDEYKLSFYNTAYTALSQPDSRNLKKYRVAVRRLISFNYLIQLLAGGGYYKPIRKELKRIIKDFNPIRDNQVLLKIVNQAIENNKNLESFKNYLLRSDDNYIDANIFYDLPKQFRRINTFLIWQKLYISTNFPNNQELTKKFENSYSQLEGELCDEFSKVNIHDSDSIHHLRLTIKKFRYFDEAAQKIYNKKLKYDNIIELQDIMGEIQDISVLQKQIKKYIHSSEKSSTEAIESYYNEMQSQKTEKIGEMILQINRNMNIEANC